MPNKFDLQTWYCSGLASQTLTNIGGTIVSGKTRFVTFIRVIKPDVIMTAALTGACVEIASVATANASIAQISAGTKMRLHMPCISAAGSYTPFVGKTICFDDVPDKPDMDHPLFAVTGSNWCAVWSRSGNSAHVPNSAAVVNLFATYYDAP